MRIRLQRSERIQMRSACVNSRHRKEKAQREDEKDKQRRKKESKVLKKIARREKERLGQEDIFTAGLLRIVVVRCE